MVRSSQLRHHSRLRCPDLDRGGLRLRLWRLRWPTVSSLDQGNLNFPFYSIAGVNEGREDEKGTGIRAHSHRGPKTPKQRGQKEA